MSESMQDYARESTEKNQIVSTLLPTLDKLLDLKMEIMQALKNTDEAIDEVVETLEENGIKF